MVVGGRRRRGSLLFVLLCLISTPWALTVSASTTGSDDASDEVLEATFSYDVDAIDGHAGKPYLFTDDSGETMYSASRLLKQQWLDAGAPGADEILERSEAVTTGGRTSGRSCTPLTQGSSITVPSAAGSVDGTVAKTTPTAAFIVQNGRTVSSTVLNNLATTWDQTVYPTATTYFGRNYNDGRGLAAPDVDNNCQVFVVIFDIDVSGAAGYFVPSFSNSRESIYIDLPVASQASSGVVLAHELQHVLHNAADPFENAWIDEGNADMAAFLCFGAQSSLTSHSNAWATSPELSVRWWNQRLADYGAGFLFMLYLADHLGGGPAIRALVADTTTGGRSIENLARNPISGPSGVIGTTMSEIFANFSAAATLDSSQGILGLSNIQTTPVCGGSSFCRLQITESNSDWSNAWSSLGNSVEGWGIRAFEFEPGSASAAPLTMRFTGSSAGFAGRILSQDASSGAWAVQDVAFRGAVGTALIPGFGDTVDRVIALTWYESSPADCDYTSCGATYPTGTIDVEAARITSPATLTFDGTEMEDRDENGFEDTVRLNLSVTSDAFFEDLDVTARVYNASNVLIDETTERVPAGGGVAAPASFWFTAASSENHRFEFIMEDLLGARIDTTQTSPVPLSNMLPTAMAGVAVNSTLTYQNVPFSGGGEDRWGITTSNRTLPHVDAPVAYAWMFSDGTTSGLRSPVRSFSEVGVINASLSVMDAGGAWSPSNQVSVNITDETDPVPVIAVNNVQVQDGLEVRTHQTVLFSGALSTDNVPIQNLRYIWDWGDGRSSEGIGLYEAMHAWGDVVGPNATYLLNLTISDGRNVASTTINVTVMNQAPVVLETDPLVTETLNGIQMPTLFEDPDGIIQSVTWTFDEGVVLQAGTVPATSSFTVLTTSQSNPYVAWSTSGVKNVTVMGTDEDGATVETTISVLVENQRPIARFTVTSPSRGVGSSPIDFRIEDATLFDLYAFDARSSFDPDAAPGQQVPLSYAWTFSDGFTSTDAQFSRTFEAPGDLHLSVVVTDAEGRASIPKNLTIRIENPLPLVELRVVQGILEDTLITDETPLVDGRQPDRRIRVFDEHDHDRAAPGTMLWFDSSGTRDGDPRFALGTVPFDREDPAWNGLISYEWDFGDGSPIVRIAEPMHAYSAPGNYTVTLTVRDAFRTGDVARASLNVIVDAHPMFDGSALPSEIHPDEATTLRVFLSDAELDANVLYFVDEDADDGSDVDRDRPLRDALTVEWELDDSLDSDGDGDPTNDWQRFEDATEVSTVWATLGPRTVMIRVCDPMDLCITERLSIDVTERPVELPSISDFSFQEWTAWALRTGGDSAVVLALVAVILVLGWFLLRAPTEEEEDARAFGETYDIEATPDYGGVKGMDHHVPPPAPKLVSKDERRSDDSGYVRPLRRR